MAVLGVQYSASCVVRSSLRNAIHATASKGAVVRYRTKSTRSGAPEPRRTEQSAASPSTSSLSTPPNSVEDHRRYRLNRTPIYGPAKVSTLDPTRLTPHNFLILSDKAAVQTQAYRRSVADRHRIYLPASARMPNKRFPMHTHGYLYYHLAPNAPALSGQVRFRITPTNDPVLFSSGEDLLGTDHLPWRLPLISLATRKNYAGLFRRLRDDGLLSEHVVRAISSLPPGTAQLNACFSRIVHALGQPFLLVFGQTRQSFYFIGTDTVLREDFVSVAIKKDAATRPTCAPTVRGARHMHCGRSVAADHRDVFLGSALCRFEKSVRPEHAGRRVVVCRVVRIVGRLERTEFCNVPENLMPREGELLRPPIIGAGSDLGDGEWAFDVDRHLLLGPDALRRPLAAGLDLLYDNEARAGGPVGW